MCTHTHTHIHIHYKYICVCVRVCVYIHVYIYICTYSNREKRHTTILQCARLTLCHLRTSHSEPLPSNTTTILFDFLFYFLQLMLVTFGVIRDLFQHIGFVDGLIMTTLRIQNIVKKNFLPIVVYLWTASLFFVDCCWVSTGVCVRDAESERQQLKPTFIQSMRTERDNVVYWKTNGKIDN